MIPLLLNILQWYIGIGIGVVLSLACVTKGFDGFSSAAQNTVFKNRIWFFVLIVILLWPALLYYGMFDYDNDDEEDEE